ncbi:cupin domain-containing protein [Ureaplasma ceti]|uniref:Cupin type-2 domain-containing protein n=1 Tax=Ureaplasma ceti TaxID=3119530 RepID=A0ABP9U9L5_9BACT
MIKVITNEEGFQIKTENFKLLNKFGQAGDTFPKHNHEGYNIVFTVLAGEIEATMNSTDVYHLQPGQILSFNGSEYISFKFLKDGHITVTLIKE